MNDAIPIEQPVSLEAERAASRERQRAKDELRRLRFPETAEEHYHANFRCGSRDPSRSWEDK